MKTEEFFALARERYNIYLKKEAGEPAPWTKDEILRQFKFCNVFREDDRTTVWLRENIRDPLKSSPSVFQAVLIARWFNRISTMEIIKDVLLADEWTNEKGVELLTGVSPLLSAAYLIRSPSGMDKLTGMLWQIDQCLDRVRAKAVEIQHAARAYSLKEVADWLATFPGIGEFMAYEIVSDLRHTDLLSDAPDILTWANPGPGCEKGIKHLLDGPTGGKASMILTMQELLELSREEENWPWQDRPWEMREVEHMLCEFDKHQRTVKGEGTPKQFYNGGGGPRTIAYGQGTNRNAPAQKKIVDPTEALIQSKLKPIYEEIDILNAILVKEVLDFARVQIESNNVPLNWLPYVEEIVVLSKDGSNSATFALSPPERLPSYYQEEGIKVDMPQFEQIRELEKKLVERERAIRSVLEDI